MKDWKLIIAEWAFVLSLISVCLWGIAKDNEHIDVPNKTEVATIVDTIFISKEKEDKDEDWDIFTRALIWVESKGDSKARGKKNDVGVLQFTPILVDDVNRILGKEVYTLNDRLDSLKSVEMFNIIQDHYNPQHDYHWALKIWNCHAPQSYHRKVMDKFNEIKNEAR